MLRQVHQYHRSPQQPQESQMPRQVHQYQPLPQQQQILFMHQVWPQPPPLSSAIDDKCPLADNLHLAPWPPQYRGAPPLKYFGDSEPHKFLMCYEATIASSGVDETTLAKSFIISLVGTTTNWYAKLQQASLNRVTI
jgi:hypothetical protein